MKNISVFLSKHKEAEIARSTPNLVQNLPCQWKCGDFHVSTDKSENTTDIDNGTINIILKWAMQTISLHCP